MVILYRKINGHVVSSQIRAQCVLLSYFPISKHLYFGLPLSVLLLLFSHLWASLGGGLGLSAVEHEEVIIPGFLLHTLLTNKDKLRNYQQKRVNITKCYLYRNFKDGSAWETGTLS